LSIFFYNYVIDRVAVLSLTQSSFMSTYIPLYIAKLKNADHQLTNLCSRCKLLITKP